MHDVQIGIVDGGKEQVGRTGFPSSGFDKSMEDTHVFKKNHYVDIEINP